MSDNRFTPPPYPDWWLVKKQGESYKLAYKKKTAFDARADAAVEFQCDAMSLRVKAYSEVVQDILDRKVVAETEIQALDKEADKTEKVGNASGASIIRTNADKLRGAVAEFDRELKRIAALVKG